MALNDESVYQNAKQAVESAVNYQVDPELIVTTTRLDDGSYIELSRFGDLTWRLPDALFPNYSGEYEKVLNFSRVSLSFRYTLKVLVLRYYLFGLEGSGRPRGATVRHFFSNSVLFLRFINKNRVDRLAIINTLLTSQYVKATRSKASSHTGKRLGAQALYNKFSAVELMHLLSRHTPDPMPHPWPETSAAILSGLLDKRAGAAKTFIIPDAVLSNLFSQAHACLADAELLLDHRDAADRWQREKVYSTTLNQKLAQRGYSDGLKSLRREVSLLLGACMVILLIVSGIRISELASLRRGCAYTTVGDDGERYHWIRGHSDKTHEGETSWLVPEIAHVAFKAAERATEPLSKIIQADIESRLSVNNHCPEAAFMKRHRDSVFIGQSSKKDNRVNSLAGPGIRKRINIFAKAYGHDWHFTPHQFRRTFAVYAARSAYGDLRYLREHFKHWSLDMTAMYAMNEHQDAELYDEILASLRNINVDVLEHWLDQGTPVSGGMAKQIKNFRQKHEAVATYAGRLEMAERLSAHVFIRSTGVAWCTADFGGCNGGQAAEIARCGDCQQSVIDDTKQAVWEGIYAQQIELRQLNDIGPSGQHRVERDIARCKKVLSELGADPERLIRHG